MRTDAFKMFYSKTSWDSLILKRWNIASVFMVVCLAILLPDQANAGFVKRVNFQPTYMTADEVTSYVRSFLAKASSMDKANEEHYLPETYAEDLHHKIDNLMPSQLYFRWLLKTKAITDNALATTYQNNINAPCAKISVFNQTLASILNSWDGDRTIVANELEQWHRDNERTPAAELCNRFRGLTCQFRKATAPEFDQGRMSVPTNESTCQCGGDPQNIGFYKMPALDTSDTKKAAENNAQRFPEGCYVRPWRPCKHLSAVDAAFKDAYHDYHNSLEQERRVLAQMVFPVARTHRCKQGTYCFDLIPGFKKPVCWCNLNNNVDRACKESKMNATKHSVPLLGSSELMFIRKNFMKLVLPATDTKSACIPDFNDDIRKLISAAPGDPTVTGSVDILRKILQSKKKNLKICDFREALLCDSKTRTCVGNMNCGIGKVHLGQGVCAINNGFQCQSNEDCVVNARCKYLKQVKDSACVCETGYGDRCLLQNRPLFGSRFLPMVSGFQDNEFIQLQTEIGKVMETWEDSMTLRLGAKCDVTLDKDAMAIVEYFGNLEKYDKNMGDELLRKARRLGRDGNALQCKYTHFLRCDPIQSKCVPLIGKKMITSMDATGENTFSVELEAGQNCEPEIPQLFVEKVKFTCAKGYTCQTSGGPRKHCAPDCNSPFAPKSCRGLENLKEKVLYMTAEWDAIKGVPNPLPRASIMARMAYPSTFAANPPCMNETEVCIPSPEICDQTGVICPHNCSTNTILMDEVFELDCPATIVNSTPAVCHLKYNGTDCDSSASPYGCVEDPTSTGGGICKFDCTKAIGGTTPTPTICENKCDGKKCNLTCNSNSCVNLNCSKICLDCKNETETCTVCEQINAPCAHNCSNTTTIIEAELTCPAAITTGPDVCSLTYYGAACDGKSASYGCMADTTGSGGTCKFNCSNVECESKCDGKNCSLTCDKVVCPFNAVCTKQCNDPPVTTTTTTTTTTSTTTTSTTTAPTMICKDLPCNGTDCIFDCASTNYTFDCKPPNNCTLASSDGTDTCTTFNCVGNDCGFICTSKKNCSSICIGKICNLTCDGKDCPHIPTLKECTTPPTTTKSTTSSTTTTTSTTTTRRTTTKPKPPPNPPPSTPPPTPPPKVNLKLNEECDTKNDKCTKKFYLRCDPVPNPKYVNQGVCNCFESLWDKGDDKPCAIPYDGPCGEGFDKSQGSFGDVYKGIPDCYDGQCTMVNSSPFCRPKDGEYSMFLTKEQLAKLRAKMQTGSGSIMRSNLAMITASMTTSMTFFWINTKTCI